MLALTGAALPVHSEHGLPSLLMLYFYPLAPSPTIAMWHDCQLPGKVHFAHPPLWPRFFCVVAPFAFPPPGTCTKHAERSFC